MMPSIFQTEDDLLQLIASLTNESKFKHRDFVESLIGFCTNNAFNAKLGVIFGLRSTGKTVGMLQAAEFLLRQGNKVAFARFNRHDQGMGNANREILTLAKAGYSHFFIDNAPYLEGFMNSCTEWSDLFAPQHRLKIIITGSDSFSLWSLMHGELCDRYVCFLTNSNTLSECKRLLGKGYDECKADGGLFLEGYAPISELSLDSTDANIENFIECAVVYNLTHSLKLCTEDYTSTGNYYTDWLYAIDKPIVYKSVLYLLEQAAVAMIKKNLMRNSSEQCFSNLAETIDKWSSLEKSRITSEFFRNLFEIKYPENTVGVLLVFLIKIGLLIESGSFEVISNKLHYTKMLQTVHFAHPALLSYALDQANKSLMSIRDIDTELLSRSIAMASERALNENIVYCHFIRLADKSDKIFPYHDMQDRVIDVVSVNRRLNRLRLVEVENKSEIDDSMVFENEAKALYDKEILKIIGVDEKFSITRIIAYKGENKRMSNDDGDLFLLNIEYLLHRIKDLEKPNF
ncbi:MAG: AAA family ATPase [Clostridiales bacterium]|jgi:predicted AAA+ superfamily ATPase|nr:AAA family ATPase [Clostridiales bacterium]